MFDIAPLFWWDDAPSWPSRLLAPAGHAYGAVAGRRMGRPGRVLTVPVLCIGNFTVGGAGKTPVALEIGYRLRELGHRPAFLSRGYGRRSMGRGVIEVDAGRHTVGEVGDEPLLLARCAPTFVAADRLRAAEAAIVTGASILIMDDGLQNPAIAKTASIVVVDGETGIGNGSCIPAGPLRAPLGAQWPKVSLLCVVGAGHAGERLGAQASRLGIPVVAAHIEADAPTLETLRGRRLFAFSGIGRPEKFFRTLEEGGLNVVDRRAFGDHHVYSADERKDLLRRAHLSGAELVTTGKDWVRLPVDFDCRVLPVRMVFDQGDAAIDSLLDDIARGPISRA